MNNSKRLRVLVVDDTIVYRKIVGDILSELPNVEVVGTANNGKIAMAKIASLKPDLITLDIEMPEMNGLEVLTQIREEASDVGAIMLSTLTQEGGDMTIKALELGAFDFIPKPQDGGSRDENRETIKGMLLPMLKAFVNRQEIKNILKGKMPYAGKEKTSKKVEKPDNVVARMRMISDTHKPKSEIIAIGISTGGPIALSKMMPKIPKNIGVPILVVQHMPPVFTRSLADSLNGKCSLEVREARDGEVLSPNTVLIAPGGKQMKVAATADGKNRIIRITNDPPENSCKPSVDYLFRSVAYHYVGRATGVIMTGMGTDGNTGLRLMKRNGSFIIAQDELSCTVFGMPKEPIESGIVDVISSIDTISAVITNTVKKAF